MPIDPVYNPHLPSTSVWTPSASARDSSSRWSEGTRPSWSAMSAGLIAGAVVGAGLALIFAPARGSEFRHSIRRYASEGGDRLSRLVENGRAIAGDAVHRASSLIEQGRRAFRTGSGSLNTDWPDSTSASLPSAT